MDPTTAPPTAVRAPHLRRGMAYAAFTVVWNVVEAAVAIGAGAAASSVALLGFGIDALIETASAVIVGLRLRREWAGRDTEGAEANERRAARLAGALLLALAAYIVVDAGRRLAGFGAAAGESPIGLALTSSSLVVMPILGRAKLRTAAALGSRALRADAFETIACAWLSLTTLAGLALNALLGWSWADPLAALVLVPLIVREGLESWRGECDEACHDDRS